MIDQINSKYGIELKEYEHLNWNECGFSKKDGALTRLGFYGLPLGDVPAQVFDIGSLTMLSLVGNGIKQIPANIEKLRNLQELYIGGNALASLPSQIGNLQNLVYLYIMEDELRTLPAAFAGLPHLKELVISTNHSTQIIEVIHFYGIKSEKTVINNIEIP